MGACESVRKQYATASISLCGRGSAGDSRRALCVRGAASDVSSIVDDLRQQHRIPLHERSHGAA
eukprot:6227409-Prymnesium_polylepis.1